MMCVITSVSNNNVMDIVLLKKYRENVALII